MAVYFVTGKLGAGKTLVSIARIRDKLNKNCKVATNIDLQLHKLINIKARKATVYRIPDKPELEDLEAIGIGNPTYDEDKNGLLVLDECGTWFNSRTWGDKSRQHVINWFLHARKLGWDIIFLVQDISIVDKQAREALAEHVVYCRRMDRITLPFIGFFWSLFTQSKLPLPRLHIAVVKYGHHIQSLTVDRWMYTGASLYNAYDTKQVFSNDYDHKTYQLLPPYYSHYRYQVKKDGRFYMKMTKIYWKRFSRPLVFILGLTLGFITTTGFILNDLVQQKKQTQAASTAKENKPTEPAFNGSRIIGYSKLGTFENYRILTAELEQLTTQQLADKGYQLKSVSACHLILSRGNKNEEIRC